MTIDETNKIDMVQIDRGPGEVFLTISDYLDWMSSKKDISLLQDKLNAYPRFIHEGQLHEEIPEALGRKS